LYLDLPTPFDPDELSFSAPKLMKPTIKSNPTMTMFDPDWQTMIVSETIQMIKSTLDHHNILDDNEHFTKFQQVLEYPNISQSTFECYFQLSVQYKSFFLEIDHSQLLQMFTKLYSGNHQNCAIVLHLKLEGAACQHTQSFLPSDCTSQYKAVRECCSSRDNHQ
jgi:hypothetical protein